MDSKVRKWMGVVIVVLTLILAIYHFMNPT